VIILKPILATETGVWQTSLINGGLTVWDAEPGFPNVRVDMLQYRASDGLLAAATHGRGIFTAVIGAAPTCGTVAGLTSSAITTTSATLSWSALGGALNYDVDYKLTSSGTWTNAATATATTSINLSGLASGSLYDWRVRANCTGSTGAYSQAQFTTTAASCGTVTGLTSSNITTTGATVGWSALSGALNYDVDYKLASSGTWTNAATATAATSINLSGLTSGSLYDWRVRANCSGASGAYAQAQFTTLTSSVCPGVYDNASNGTRNGADVIPFNTNIYGLINPSGDNDYYRFNLSSPGTFTATLTTLPANYDLVIYRNNSQVAISQNAGTTSESITFNATQVGPYYARVLANTTESNATSCYITECDFGYSYGSGYCSTGWFK
jgi:hypothetical protein